MGSLGALVRNPDDFYPLFKLKMAARHAEKQIPSKPHWAFCFSMLLKVSRSFAFVIQQLDTKLRNAVSIDFCFGCWILFEFYMPFYLIVISLLMILFIDIYMGFNSSGRVIILQSCCFDFCLSIFLFTMFWFSNLKYTILWLCRCAYFIWFFEPLIPLVCSWNL